MLVLTRREGQVVNMLDGLIKVEVLEINGDQVRIGFTAPPEIDIVRTEATDKLPKP